MKPGLWWGLLGLALVATSGNYLRQALRPPRTELPVLGTVQPFVLRDQTNREFTQKDVGGKLWIADFIYTTCPDQCPLMTRKMAALEELLPQASQVKLVSISVDPEHDTPAVLAQYAARYKADASRWHFLTGKYGVVQRLLEDFKLSSPGKDATSRRMNHSLRLILVDANAGIRGYYDATEPSDMQRLLKDVSGLAEGRS